MDEKYLEKVIGEDVEGNEPTLVCWYKGGIAVFGPNKEIRVGIFFYINFSFRKEKII